MTRNLLTILVLALAARAAGAEKFHGAKGSIVRVEGTSTLHAWTMESAAVRGQIDAPAPDHWNGPAKAVVTIPVASIRSEHAKMDVLMARALDAETHPEIRFEMIAARPRRATADAFVLETTGRLTIAGVTREVAFDVHGTREAGGRYALTGTAPIRMSHYGIKPPTAMLGTIRTGDDVKVTFRWIVERAQ